MSTGESHEVELLRRRVAELEHELACARAAEQPALPERAALLEEAERAAQVGTWVWDLTSNQVFWSKQLFRILGYDPARDLASVDAFFAALHPDDVERVRATSQRSIAGGEAIPTVMRVLHRDGTERECFMDASPIYDTQGRLTRFVGTILDLTDRRRSERELRRRERMLVEAQRIAHVGSWTWDLASNRVEWSAALFQLYGVPADTPSTLDLLRDRVHAEDRSRFMEAVHRAALGEASELECCIVRTDTGEERHVQMAAQPIHDEAGEATGVLGTSLDITERRRLEEQLLHSQKLEAVGRLAGGVAHDFNNMLTAIFGNIELAARRAAPGSLVRAHMDEIHAAAERASGLTRQLLAFARKQIIRPAVVDPSALVLGVERLLRPLLGEDVDLHVVSRPDVWSILIDRGQFEQVLINLAVNAKDAMPGGGRLTIEIGNVTLDAEYCSGRTGVAPGDYVELAVTDSGQGMDPSIQQHVFEPFFTTKEAGRGTGLGLATCHGIVKQHGGHIWFYSEPGRGTCFKLYFPRTRAPVDEETARPSVPVAGGHETILVVEDDAQVRELCAGALRSYGYTVLSARTGKDALDAAAAHPGAIHLLLSDVVLPDMRGTDVAREVARARAGVRVLYASGYTANAIVHQGVLDPGVNFLAKPYTLTQLARMVRKVLDATL